MLRAANKGEVHPDTITEVAAADAETEGASTGAFRNALAFVRTRLFECFVLLWSLPFGVIILTYFQIYRPPRHVRIVLRAWSSGFIAGAWAILGVRFKLEGLENIPETPVIFACNHQSYWESIALTAFIPHVNVVAKRAAMRIPVFGWGLQHAPMIPVDRENLGANIWRLISQSRDSLAEGRSILIFPEGTRVKPGAHRRFERGLQFLYKNCDAPVVPIIHNAGLLWPPGFGLKRPGLVTMRFLPAIPAGENDKAFACRIETLLNTEKDALPGVAATAAASQD